jgi:AhpD family alkylhydroperoxidase
VKMRLEPAKVSPAAYHAMLGLESFVSKSSKLEISLLELVKMRASQINGCAFSIDMHSKDARVNGETEQRLYALSAWRETTFFTNRERAALAWTEALTLITEGRAPDEVYAEVRKEVWRGRTGQPLIGDHHDQRLESTCNRFPQDPR